MAEIGVIGSGSWGCAITWLLANNGHRVTLWSHRAEECAMLEKYHENVDRLPGVKLPNTVSFTTDMEKAVKDKLILVCAVPSVAIRSTAAMMRPYVEDGKIIVSLTKGIEEGTNLTMTGILKEEIPNSEPAVMSGPSHAEEVGKGLPTTIVVGSVNKEATALIQKLFSSSTFRTYTSEDCLGIELGGALKNVIALAAGMADGLGYGDNTKAALITRGIAEISRLGEAMGASKATFYGLSGIGDLVVTCASVHSRNRKAGFLIGQGRSMQQAMDEVHMVVEGVYSAKAAFSLSKIYGIDMPIVTQVNRILFENKAAAEAVNELMQRDLKAE